MIDYAMYCKMMHMNHEGLNASKIAAALAADVRTVRKWLLRKGFAPRTGSRRDACRPTRRRLDRRPRPPARS